MLIVDDWDAPTLNSYDKAWKKVDGYYRNADGSKIKAASKKGIDVSYHNGTINWEKVKKDGMILQSFAVVLVPIRNPMMTPNGKRM